MNEISFMFMSDCVKKTSTMFNIGGIGNDTNMLEVPIRHFEMQVIP